MNASPQRKPRNKLTPRQRALVQHPWMRREDPPVKPELEFTRFSVAELLQEIHHEHFTEYPLPEICFTATKPIACIHTNPEISKPFILINCALNRKETPLEVIRAIVKHECIHLVVRPEIINEKRVSHPPAFGEMERKISPEIDNAWIYLIWNFIGGLTRLPEDEHNESQLLIDPRYAKKRREQPTFTFEECLSFSQPGETDGSGTIGEAILTV